MAVQVGDRFSKTDAPHIIWEVSRILTQNFPTPHAALVEEGRPRRQITLSVSALETPAMYLKVVE